MDIVILVPLEMSLAEVKSFHSTLQVSEIPLQVLSHQEEQNGPRFWSDILFNWSGGLTEGDVLSRPCRSPMNQKDISPLHIVLFIQARLF